MILYLFHVNSRCTVCVECSKVNKRLTRRTAKFKMLETDVKRQFGS